MSPAYLARVCLASLDAHLDYMVATLLSTKATKFSADDCYSLAKVISHPITCVRVVTGDGGEIVAMWLAANHDAEDLIRVLKSVRGVCLLHDKEPDTLAVDCVCCNGVEGSDAKLMPAARALMDGKRQVCLRNSRERACSGGATIATYLTQPADPAPQSSMDNFHFQKRIKLGLNKGSTQTKPFIDDLSNILLVPVPESILAVLTAMRAKSPATWGQMTDEQLLPEAIALGKADRTLRRFTPPARVTLQNFDALIEAARRRDAEEHPSNKLIIPIKFDDEVRKARIHIVNGCCTDPEGVSFYENIPGKFSPLGLQKMYCTRGESWSELFFQRAGSLLQGTRNGPYASSLLLVFAAFVMTVEHRCNRLGAEPPDDVLLWNQVRAAAWRGQLGLPPLVTPGYDIMPPAAPTEATRHFGVDPSLVSEPESKYFAAAQFRLLKNRFLMFSSPTGKGGVGALLAPSLRSQRAPADAQTLAALRELRGVSGDVMGIAVESVGTVLPSSVLVLERKPVPEPAVVAGSAAAALLHSSWAVEPPPPLPMPPPPPPPPLQPALSELPILLGGGSAGRSPGATVQRLAPLAMGNFCTEVETPAERFLFMEILSCDFGGAAPTNAGGWARFAALYNAAVTEHTSMLRRGAIPELRPKQPAALVRHSQSLQRSLAAAAGAAPSAAAAAVRSGALRAAHALAHAAVPAPPPAALPTASFGTGALPPPPPAWTRPPAVGEPAAKKARTAPRAKGCCGFFVEDKGAVHKSRIKCPNQLRIRTVCKHWADVTEGPLPGYVEGGSKTEVNWRTAARAREMAAAWREHSTARPAAAAPSPAPQQS